jgi:hypothetical protein
MTVLCNESVIVLQCIVKQSYIRSNVNTVWQLSFLPFLYCFGTGEGSGRDCLSCENVCRGLTSSKNFKLVDCAVVYFVKMHFSVASGTLIMFTF